jgi:error-prone DNA polymerase
VGGFAVRLGLRMVKGLRDEPLPLFAAASARDRETVPEIDEPIVELRPMTAGSEVVEDYSHVGLTLRHHPVAFLREDLRRQRIITCRETMESRDGRWAETAGIVLVRQMPGSAKGVIFITLEDESGIANLVIWPAIFEKQRRVILSAGMMAAYGRIQRVGDVVHLVAQRLTDLSSELASVGDRDCAFPLPHGRGDELHHGSPGVDPRSKPKGLKPRSILDPYGHIDQIKVKARNFR